ncbi:hypothetical protein EV421DRAFT_1739850 [Armillaria borealis]|uniref:Uncharacterized protein n=1 Tax=Armillaria borealis TaxID=47425 RepID=A0AA39J604_9AGAR|nr:hypothetical protein EV421DRAFT_1739850 [Armillaria borealis]
MQISIDFSTRTLVTIAVTALSFTITLTIFVLYRMYKDEIEQFAHRLYQGARHFFIPAYIERPGGVFVPNPHLYPIPKRTPTPYHYVADPFREWEGPLTFPPLFESQSTGLSSPTNEQDIGQEGGHIIHEEYKMIPSIPDTILPEEGVYNLTPRRVSLSLLSSPEFPLREPGIPIVIRDNSKTTSHEATAREELARLTTAKYELAQLTLNNDEFKHTIACDRTIAGFYERASHPQLEREPAAQYWQRQTASRTEADAINEVETEDYCQCPLHEPVWLERYRQYRSLQIEQGLPGVSLATWME